jgi:hypothetical protein
MTNEANDIYKQAKNGSVAAIIQVLNEKLTDSGVRTRAVFEDGMLQLLCEGQTLDQLEQPVLVERIRYILESISPRSIRKVNIYSRIVREQQLLWLDEINRDRENQVLWSEIITLKQPNFFKRLQDDWADRSTDSSRSEKPPTPPQRTSSKWREKRQFQRGLMGGIVASGLLLLGGWFLYNRLMGGEPQPVDVSTNPEQASTPTAAPQSARIATKADDPFADAVRLAERTSQGSQTAQTSAEWLALAAQWQKASDLMAQVEAADTRYKTAQDRVGSYRKNSEVALEKARQGQPSQP